MRRLLAWARWLGALVLATTALAGAVAAFPAAAATSPGSLSPTPPVPLPSSPAGHHAAGHSARPRRATSPGRWPSQLPATGGEPLAIAAFGAAMLAAGLALRVRVARDGR